MDFENQIKLLGKDIYQKVISFVEANKGDDDKLYRGAKLKLKDGREMFVPFNPWGGQPDIKIWNYEWNEELQRGNGDAFSIMAESGYGFLVDITFYNLDKDNTHFVASDMKYPHQKELSADEINAIKNYMAQLYEQVSTLEYDKEATRSISNFTQEARRQYNIQLFNNEMKKLNETESTTKVLPSVETAVNWWINIMNGPTLGGSLGDDINAHLTMRAAEKQFSQTSIDENQLIMFRDSLSKAIMDQLSQGLEVKLDVDYGPSGILLDAIMESGISGSKTPFKTNMVVNVDSVRVSAGYRAEYEEIFNNSVQEEMKPKGRV